MDWMNLDLKCAESAEAIVREVPDNVKRQDLEKLCADAGAVLARHGPYAFFLHLWAKGRRDNENKESEAAPLALAHGAYGILRDVFQLPGTPGRQEPKEDVLRQVAGLSTNLNHLLLAKKLLHQTVNYSRCHSKARSGSENKGKTRGRPGR